MIINTFPDNCRFRMTLYPCVCVVMTRVGYQRLVVAQVLHARPTAQVLHSREAQVLQLHARVEARALHARAAQVLYARTVARVLHARSSQVLHTRSAALAATRVLHARADEQRSWFYFATIAVAIFDSPVLFLSQERVLLWQVRGSPSKVCSPEPTNLCWPPVCCLAFATHSTAIFFI